MPRNHPERWPQPKQSARSEGWFGPPETTRAGAAERQTRASNLAQDNSLSGTVGQCGHKQVKWSRNVVIAFPGRVQSRVLLLADFETDGFHAQGLASPSASGSSPGTFSRDYQDQQVRLR
jgi:hypothetical protein